MSKKLSQLFLEEYKKLLNEQDPMSKYGGEYQREELPSDYLGPQGQALTNIGLSNAQLQQAEDNGTLADRFGDKNTYLPPTERPKEIVSLYDLFDAWNKQEESDIKFIENGWTNYLDAYGEPLEDKEGDRNIGKAKKAFAIYQKNQDEEKNSTLSKLKDQLLFELPKFTYVELGTNKKFDKAPDNWNTQQFGGFYDSNPPAFLFEPISETTVLTAINNDELTNDNSFNSEYKKYRSPKDIENQFYKANENKDFKKFGIIQSSKSELENNPILEELFGRDNIRNAMANCPGGEAEMFLRDVVRGIILDDAKKVVGRKYPGMSDRVRYKPLPGSKYGGIPCQSMAYYRYGILSQVLVGVLTMVLVPVGGWVTYLALATEAVVNLWAAKEDMERQDANAVALDVAFLFIPFILESQSFKRGLQFIQMPNADAVYNGLLSKIRNVPKVNGKYDAIELKNLFLSLTDDEKKFLAYVKDSNNKELADFLKLAGKEAEKKMIELSKKTILKPLSYFRRNLKNIVTMSIIGVPLTLFFSKQLIETFEKGLRRPLSQDEKEFLSVLSTFYSEDQQKKFEQQTAETMEKILELAKTYKQEKEKAQKDEGYTEQDIQEINDFASTFAKIFQEAMSEAGVEPCKDNNGQITPCPEKEKQVNQSNK